MSDKRRQKQQKRAKRKGRGRAHKAASRVRSLHDQELADEAVDALTPILPLADEGGPLAAWLAPDQLVLDAIGATGTVVGAAQHKVARALATDATWLAAARDALARCEAERRAEVPPEAAEQDMDLAGYTEAGFWLAPGMLETQALADQNALLAILYAHAANAAVRRGILPTTLLDGDATRIDLRREHESQRRARALYRASMGPLPAAALDAIVPPGAAWVEEVRDLSAKIHERGERIERAFAEEATATRMAAIAGGLRAASAASLAAGAAVAAFDLACIAESLGDDTIIVLGEETLPRSVATLRALFVTSLEARGAAPDEAALAAYIREREAEQ